MKLSFQCPNGHALLISASQAGCRFDCPICGAPTQAPRNEPRGNASSTRKRRGYRADAAHRRTVYWLGVALLAVTLIGAVPLWGMGAIGQAPAWAQVVGFLTLLQFAYVVYLVALPDWSTVGVAMLVFGAVAALYAGMMAMVLWTPGSEPLALGLEAVRPRVGLWCGAMLLLTFAGACGCGRLRFTWRRQFDSALRG